MSHKVDLGCHCIHQETVRRGRMLGTARSAGMGAMGMPRERIRRFDRTGGCAARWVHHLPDAGA